jgi:NTE family protein
LASCASSYLPSLVQTEIQPFEPQKPVHLALVLGGGGSKGLAHLGAIRELEAAGIRPDLIVGCSAGAMVGALYADEPGLKEIDKVLLNLKRSDLIDTSFFQFRFGVAKGKALEAFMKKNLRARSFKELKIPLIVVATDLYNGEVVELSQDDIPIAIRASCAFPGIFEPVLLHGRYLIDGGAGSPMPVDIAKKHGAKVVIAIDVGEKLPETKPSHLFGIAKRGLEIAYRKFVAHSLALADIVIKMDFQDVGTFTDHLNEQMYEHGRKQVLSSLPEIKRKLAAASKELPSSSILEAK